MISTLIPHDPGAARTLVTSVAMLALLTAGVYIGQGCNEEPEPRTVTETDTTYVERTITKRDTITETRPVEVIRYDTVRQSETDTIKVEVPTQDSSGTSVPWRPYGLIGEQPVSVDGPVATLSYWKVAEARWEQRKYRLNVDQPQWALWPAVTARTTPLGLQATAALSLRYRKVTLTAGYTTLAGERGFTAGLAVRPFTLKW